MKRFFVAALMIAMTASGAFAAPDGVLDDKSIQLFIKVFPKYLQLTEKYQEEISENNGPKKESRYRREVQVLFRKYKVNIDQFAGMVRKVTYAVSAVKMKQNGVPASWLDDPSFVTQAELVSVEKYLPQLEAILR